MKLQTILFVLAAGTVTLLPLAASAGTIVPCVVEMPGDVNIDGPLTSADIIYAVNYVFKGGAAPLPVPEAADVNCDSAVTSADIIYLVGHVFKGSSPPCNTCFLYTELSDAHSFAAVDSVHQNLKNSLCETGPSSVVWWTPAVPKWEYDTVVVADTTEYSERCKFTDSAGTYSVNPPVAAGVVPFEPGRDPISGNAAVAAGTVVSFPGAQFVEGSEEGWGTIRIDGNVVSIRGRDIWFRSPAPLDPPLADQVVAARSQPPPELTPAQIAQACGEGSLNIANCRISDVLETRTRCYTNTDGVECCLLKSGSFAYEHSWQYECPDGPLRRVETVTFSTYWISTCGSQVLFQGEIASTYVRTLEVR